MEKIWKNPTKTDDAFPSLKNTLPKDYEYCTALL